MERLPPSRPQSLERTSDRGFALVGLLVLAPVVMAILTALATLYFVLARKSAAQSACVQESARLQRELAGQMKALMALNRPAASLRRQREAADRALEAALASGYPPAIAAAAAVQRGVVLAQIALRARQEAILTAASLARTRRHRTLYARLRELRTSGFRAHPGPPRGLAVRAQPATSLTPDYEPVAAFEQHQQQRYEFRIGLSPPFLPDSWRSGAYTQPAACAVTLKGERQKWRVSILAVSAPSNSVW